MARYKPQEHHSLLLPVVLSEQIIPGSFTFALNYLVDHELDLSALDAQFNNDAVGASAYDPRVMLKIVLLAYSQGLISSRAIEQACQRIKGIKGVRVGIVLRYFDCAWQCGFGTDSPRRVGASADRPNNRPLRRSRLHGCYRVGSDVAGIRLG